MKTYSMKIKDYEFHMEVCIKNREVDVTEYFWFRDIPMKRNDVPKEIMRLFQQFSEDIIDLDWDQDYGYQGGVG